jgi:hypothetical protein
MIPWQSFAVTTINCSAIRQEINAAGIVNVLDELYWQISV